MDWGTAAQICALMPINESRSCLWAGKKGPGGLPGALLIALVEIRPRRPLRSYP
jgi:hypothetical protein